MRATLLLCTLIAGAAAAAPPSGTEPRPFRLEAALAGRGFTYNSESFLHRWSYRQAFPLVGSGALWDTGLWAGAGSVRSTEFYAQTWLHETIALEDWGALEFRYARDEDYDGRYDRVLLGMGWRFAAGWTATLLGDVPGDKEDIDAQLELAWAEGAERFRAALVLTDFEYDQKQTAAEYGAEPMTLFAERWWTLGASTEVYAYANANFEARWHEFATNRDLADRAAEGGLGVRHRLDDERMLRGYLRGGSATRDDADPAAATRLAREHFDAALQYERPAWGRPAWFGLRLLRLDEALASTAAPTTRFEHRELLLYGGSRWRLSERTSFAPELELAWVDALDEVAAPGAPPVRVLLGKLTLPLEVVLDRRRGVRLVFNPGLKLHELKFGGAQLTLAVPL
jgi:hypothetical protein